MSVHLPPETPPALSYATGAAARSQWSFGKVLSRTIVVAIGIAVGFFIAIFIGLVTGWIEIRC